MQGFPVHLNLTFFSYFGLLEALAELHVVLQI